MHSRIRTLALIIVVMGSIAISFAGDKKGDPSRSITGIVVDSTEKPIFGAVVYRKNVKTLEVKSYITDEKGTFRFTGLNPNVDFEVYAEFQGKRSSTKTFSTFDGHKDIQYTLKIDK